MLSGMSSAPIAADLDREVDEEALALDQLADRARAPFAISARGIAYSISTNRTSRVLQKTL